MDCNKTEDTEANELTVAKPAIILKLKRKSFLKQFVCSVCPCSYKQLTNLKYHIRREHYNLIAKLSKREERKINDVWLETVINSDDVIEIKKAGHNKYLMKKSNNPDCVKITESSDTIDLSPLYPNSAKTRHRRVWCCVCHKGYLKTTYDKHLEKHHRHLLG